MNLTPLQVIEWMREQAAKYTRMADEMERSFGVVSGRSWLSAPVVPAGGKYIAVDDIRKIVADRKVRAKDIADALGILDAEVLRPYLTKENGFDVGDRGWITLDSEFDLLR